MTRIKRISADKRNSKLFVASALFLLFFLPSCDPAKMMIISTGNIPGVKFMAYLHGDIRGLFRTGSGSNEKSVILLSSDTGMPHDTSFFYGIGNWPETSVEQLADKIDSIVIIHPHSRLSYDTPAEIKRFLMRRRVGMMNQCIRIRAWK